MRRLAHALLVLLILPALVTGQVTVTSSGSFDPTGTNKFSGQTDISGPDSTTNVEIGSTANDANAGTGGTSVVIGNAATNSSNGTGTVVIGSTATATGNSAQVVIGAATNSPNNNAVVIGNAAASSGNPAIAIGQAASAGANQIVIGSSVTAAAKTVYFGWGATTVATASSIPVTINGIGGTGTDNPGGNLLLAPGAGTSAGNGGALILMRNLRAATGTTPQTQANAYVTCPSKILSNTSATLTTMATIGLASNSGGSALVYFSVEASDGTNFDRDAQEMNFAFVNKATVITTNASAAIGDATIGNSGSTTVGATITTGSALVNINVTPVFTTIVPTTVTGYVTITNNGAGTVICQ